MYQLFYTHRHNLSDLFYLVLSARLLWVAALIQMEIRQNEKASCSPVRPEEHDKVWYIHICFPLTISSLAQHSLSPSDFKPSQECSSIIATSILGMANLNISSPAWDNHGPGIKVVECWWRGAHGGSWNTEGAPSTGRATMTYCLKLLRRNIP